MRAGHGPAGRPAGPLNVFLDGWRRVARAPGVLVIVWALSVMGLPGFHYLTTAYILGYIATAAEVRGVDGWTVMWVVAANSLLLLVWTFLWGGIIERYARSDGASAKRFLAACWTYSGRMLRVSLIGGIAYTLAQYAEPAIFNRIANVWPFNRAFGAWVEPILFWVPVHLSMLPSYAVRVLTDLTRVRLVVENRRSVTFAIAAGWRLLAARPLTAIGIYLLSAVAFSTLSSVWPLVAFEGPYDEGWVPPAATLLFWAIRIVPEMLIPAALVALYHAEIARGTFAAERREHAPALVPNLKPDLKPDMNASLAKE